MAERNYALIRDAPALSSGLCARAEFPLAKFGNTIVRAESMRTIAWWPA